MTRLRSISPLMALLFTLTFLANVRALEFAPGSDCAAYCLDDTDGDASDTNAGTTNSTDIVCTDREFGSKNAGIKFKNCQECLAKSEYKSGSQSDMHWYLYNMRYTLSTCLFGKPAGGNIKNSPCIIDFGCGDFESSFTYDLATNSSSQPPVDDTFEYCEKSKYPFTNTHWRLDACIQCLHNEESQSYLGNFVAALNAGCEQKPDAGDRIGLTGTVFRSEIVNGTEPEEDIMDRPAGAGSATLTTGAIVGIAVGAGLLLFGGLALFCVYWRKQKKYEKSEKDGHDFFPRDNGTYTPDPFLPPQATQMTSSLRHMSGDGSSGGFGGSGGWAAKGPVVKEAEYETGNYNFDPRSMNRAPNGALPSHPAYIPSAMSRQTERGTPTPPPVAHHKNGKSIDVQSIPMHTYNTSTSSSLRGSSEERSGSQQSTHLPPPPPGPPPPAGGSNETKVPIIAVPVPKNRGPRKFSTPFMGNRNTPSPEQGQAAAVSISQPVMGNEERFHDRPLKGGPVYATEAVPASERTRGGQYAEIPMKSGKSALYGY